MAELVSAGKARLIGVSNFDRALIARCQVIHPVASVQNEFSRLHQGDRDELLPWLAAQGIGYLAYSPLAAGRLSGALAHDHEFSDDDWRSGRGKYASWRDEEDDEWPFDPEPMARGAALVDRMRPLAEQRGATVAQLALRWAIEQTGVTAVIAGSRNHAHATANAAAGSLAVDAAALAEIDQS
jgi:aryl-alcohol dehydrogenase-like predicted oxidoreductase